MKPPPLPPPLTTTTTTTQKKMKSLCNTARRVVGEEGGTGKIEKVGGAKEKGTQPTINNPTLMSNSTYKNWATPALLSSNWQLAKCGNVDSRAHTHTIESHSSRADAKDSLLSFPSFSFLLFPFSFLPIPRYLRWQSDCTQLLCMQ